MKTVAQSTRPQLVLASSSTYRAQLLSRLGLGFETVPPQIDETAANGEDPWTLVERLACQKARWVAKRFPASIVIGSDQLALIDGIVLGKSGCRERAIEQLHAASGRRVSFLTAICTLNTSTDSLRCETVVFDVDFRELSRPEIEGYVDREEPFDCAGSFKSEGLGIALFERMYGDDPTALIGLPLITLSRMLRAEGIDVLNPSPSGGVVRVRHDPRQP